MLYDHVSPKIVKSTRHCNLNYLNIRKEQYLYNIIVVFSVHSFEPSNFKASLHFIHEGIRNWCHLFHVRPDNFVHLVQEIR